VKGRPRLIYLHGFASGPKSKKAALFQRHFEARGLDLEVPDLNPPHFRDLTVGRMVEKVETLFDSRLPVALIGSSLGGYLASYVASRHSNVAALVLLAPAFDLRARWASRLGPEGLKAWQRLGAVPIYDHPLGGEQELAYRFFEESEGYPAYPDVGSTPTLVFHGRRDEVIPLAVVERFACDRKNVTLRVVDDGHDLLESAPLILDESFNFLSTETSR